MTAGTFYSLETASHRGMTASSPAQNTAQLGNSLPKMGTARGRWAFPQAADGSRGPELGASVQTQQGTPYRGVLGLGEVNEIWLLPPSLLLPLVEAICQDHAALALEESTLGRDSTREQ